MAVPSEWQPDRLQLEIDIGPAILMAYGSIVKCVVALKVNDEGSFIDLPYRWTLFKETQRLGLVELVFEKRWKPFVMKCI